MPSIQSLFLLLALIQLTSAIYLRNMTTLESFQAKSNETDDFTLIGKTNATGRIVLNKGGVVFEAVPSNSASGSRLSTLSLTIICLAVSAAVLIVGVILVALFVMRRRFSSWRLTPGSGKEGAEVASGETEVAAGEGADNVDGTAVKSPITEAENKCITCVVNEKEESMAKDSAAAVIEGVSFADAVKMPAETEATVENADVIEGVSFADAVKMGVDVSEAAKHDGADATEQGGQASPSSGSPLIEQDEGEVKKNDDVKSTSLNTSMPNDKSDSATSKLITTSEEAASSTTN